LHVDDDCYFSDVSKQILSLENTFEIDNASSVDEAFKKMEQKPYDAIVSDFEMPQKNGLEFLKALRDQNNQIPFILFTGKGREDVAVKALNLGADSYLNKNGPPETVYCELAHTINKTVERKKSIKLLKESELKYRMLVERSLQGIIIAQGDLLHVVFANPSIEEMLGYSSGEFTSLSNANMALLIYSEDKDSFFNCFENILKGNSIDKRYEFRAVRKDGSIIWMEVFGTLIEYDRQPAVQAIFLDISERKKSQEILRESELRYRELANCLPDIVFETSLDGQLEFANERAAEISGYSLSEIEEGLNILQFVVAEDREKAARSIQRLLGGSNSAPEEYTFVRKNGTTFPALISATPRFCKNKVTGLRGLVLDITERKKSEEALRESERRLKAIVANSPIGIATSNADYHFLSANEAFCRTLGYKEEELRKLTFKDITYPKDIKESFIKMRALEAGRIPCFMLEKMYVRKDGTVIHGKIMVSAVRKQSGKPSLFVAELEDITENKKAEERRKVLEKRVKDYSEHLKYIVDLRTLQLKDANERLVKSERLAAIGELAGMVGHDLRNPLAGIKNATYYLKKNCSTCPPTKTKQMLEIIEKSVDHSDKIINDLLDYAREINLELRELSARSLLDDSLQTIQVPAGIKILNALCDEPKLKVDADKIERVFVNLVKNAIDAMPNGGTISITSKQANGQLEVYFADTGVGIPEDVLPKLFSPLFTTKAQGMGFGLSICKRIVEAHKGKINVKTIKGKGTTFTLTLPLNPDQLQRK
jgi:PAS domain S-box-containing protein